MVWHNNRAVAALRRALNAVGSHGTLEVLDAPPATDAQGRLWPRLSARYQAPWGDATSFLTPIWAGEGFPQDVLRALDEAPPVAPTDVLVVAASHLSAGARAILYDRRISWVDEGGRAHISAPPALLLVRDVPWEPSRPAAPAGVRWADGPAAVAESVLSEAAASVGRHANLTVVSIATRVGVSPPLVSRVLQQFDAEGWTEKSGPVRGPAALRRLVDPGAMLSSWAAWRSSRTPSVIGAHGLIRTYETWLRDELAPRWPADSWALTGLAGLDRRAPFTTSIPTIDIYVAAETVANDNLLDGLLDDVGLRRVDRGARVRLLEADRYVLRLSSDQDGIRQVSDIRLYGDLLGAGVRGPEAADHLRTSVIGF